MGKVSILVVCTANICRSPLAEGIIKQRLVQMGMDRMIAVDSAGARVGHPGPRPDPRSQRVAHINGIDISRMKARAVKPRDFLKQDLIVAMDETNLQDLKEECPAEEQHKLTLMMDYAPHLGLREVPDPYYGNQAGFEEVFRLLEIASHGLVEHLQQNGYA